MSFEHLAQLWFLSCYIQTANAYTLLFTGSHGQLRCWEYKTPVLRDSFLPKRRSLLIIWRRWPRRTQFWSWRLHTVLCCQRAALSSEFCAESVKQVDLPQLVHIRIIMLTTPDCRDRSNNRNVNRHVFYINERRVLAYRYVDIGTQKLNGVFRVLQKPINSDSTNFDKDLNQVFQLWIINFWDQKW